MKLSATLKQAIRDSGLTHYRISKDCGVSATIIDRFLSNDPATHRDIRLEATAEKLAKTLRLAIMPQSKSHAVETMGDRLRRAIAESGGNVAAIARGAGISQPGLRLFTQGKDIRLESTADKLAEFFGLRLAAIDASQSKSARKKKA
ncbi:MAG: hypothetical protein AB7I37_19525 [Pirellulales bacterium]